MISFHSPQMVATIDNNNNVHIIEKDLTKKEQEMWANAQRDGRPVEYRWRPLFNAAKFG